MPGQTSAAVQFFYELSKFTDRFARLEFGETLKISHGGGVRSEPFRGVTLHFTADRDVLRVLRWFRHPESKVSAHLVVCDRRLGCHDELAEGLPIVQALPVTVIQCRDPGQSAWHARWVNDETYGIELVSAGPLHENKEGVLCSWRPRDQTSGLWTEPWVCGYKEPVRLYGQTWEPYTAPQVETTITAMRYLRDFGPRFAVLERPWIVGHDLVQSNKLDPGPMFPIHGVRQAVFDGWAPVHSRIWWPRFVADPLDGQGWRDLAVIRVVREHAAASETSRDPSGEVAWSRAWAAWSRLQDQQATVQAHWIKLALYVLGYAVSGYDDEDFSAAELSRDTESVRLFQRMAALTVDGIVGPWTRGALAERLWERFAVGNTGRPIA